jgi:hypothetical protein
VRFQPRERGGCHPIGTEAVDEVKINRSGCGSDEREEAALAVAGDARESLD